MISGKPVDGRCRWSAWPLAGIAGLLLSTLSAATAPAQQSEVRETAAGIFVNSELERYLRVLQVAGRAPLYPWSVRAFSTPELERLLPRDSLHPWHGRLDEGDSVRLERRRPTVELLPPRLQLIHNSGFPYGRNDGPIWAGKGLTSAVELGLAARTGALSATLMPLLFRAENAPFALAPTGDSLEFADWRNPTRIDFPQRFGDDAYTRFDPGQSRIQLDLPWVSAGLSTANQHWGPAIHHPMLLGNNAGGFYHAFLGTAKPVSLGVGRLHTRVLWGVLHQSEQSVVTGSARRRVGTGLAAVLLPHGVDGFEIGLSRFHHGAWPHDGIGLDEVLQPFEGPFSGNDGERGGRNQLASVFVRWVLPRGNAEVYGEFAREDYNEDVRDLMLEPDHDSAYLLGFRKAWEPAPQRLLVGGVEVLDARVTHLARVRNQTAFYVHTVTRQGHTQRGQILGSPAAYGGAAAEINLDYYDPAGRWSLSWGRELRQEARPDPSTGLATVDAIHAFRLESVRFSGRWEIIAGVTGAFNRNRNFEDDGFNLNTNLGVRWLW